MEKKHDKAKIKGIKAWISGLAVDYFSNQIDEDYIDELLDHIEDTFPEKQEDIIYDNIILLIRKFYFAVVRRKHVRKTKLAKKTERKFKKQEARIKRSRHVSKPGNQSPR